MIKIAEIRSLDTSANQCITERFAVCVLQLNVTLTANGQELYSQWEYQPSEKMT